MFKRLVICFFLFFVVVSPAFAGGDYQHPRLEPPITVCGPTSGVWGEALDGAIAELSRYIPVERGIGCGMNVEDTITVVAPATLRDVRVSCNNYSAVGCTQEVCFWPDGDPAPSCASVVKVAAEGVLYPQETLLHELVHAVGVLPHTNNPETVMYPSVNQVNTPELTQEDLDLLWEVFPDYEN